MTKENKCLHDTLTRSIWNDYTWNCESCGKSFNLGKTLEILEAEMKWKI